MTHTAVFITRWESQFDFSQNLDSSEMSGQDISSHIDENPSSVPLAISSISPQKTPNTPAASSPSNMAAAVASGIISSGHHPRIRLQPGAARLIDFCNAHGIRSYVLSGGFTHFTHAIATRLGMTGDFSNMLGIDAERGVLTGTVTGPAGGRILDADGKRRTLEILCHQAGATLEQAIAAGDGANDLEMIGAAALGIAYHGLMR